MLQPAPAAGVLAAGGGGAAAVAAWALRAALSAPVPPVAPEVHLRHEEGRAAECLVIELDFRGHSEAFCAGFAVQ